MASAPAGAVAVVAGERSLTFGALWERARKVAGWVAARTAPGDRVAIVGDNDPAWIEAYYGVPAAGRVLVFLNPRLAPRERDELVRRSGARVVIDDFGAWSAEIDAAAPLGRLADDPAAGAWIIYTSGTTARPKGALLTHRSLLAAVDVTAAARPIAADDVYVFPFPLCHVAGYNVIHHHSRGRPVVLLPRFTPAGFARAVSDNRATSTSLAATMLAALLDHLGDDPQPSASGAGWSASLRTIAYGAAPMPVGLLRRAHDVLGVDFAQGYGMTELSGNAVFLGPAEHRRGLAGEPWLLSTAGRPGPGVEVRLESDGEILVRGAQVMAGYWEDPAATATAITDGGWLHTGDIGRWVEDGWLAIVDRKKDVIVTGGENVSSLEVEEALRTHPAVADAAVVGVPDPRWGENVCAVVVARPGRPLDPDDVVDAVRARLAGFKVPRHVVVVDELPKNASGKVLKAQLRAWLRAEPDRAGPRR